MGTGASKAKRKAAQAAAAQYYEAFSKLEKANADFKVGDKNKKAIVDAVGDDVSYSTKRLAMQADKLGRNTNTDKEYRQNLNRYNTRVDQVQRQLKGEAVDRYYVGTPKAVEQQTDLFGRPINNGTFGFNQESTGIGSMIGLVPRKSSSDIGKKRANTRYYASQEEAASDAQQAMERHNKSWDAQLGKPIEKGTTKSTSGIGGWALNATPLGNYTQKQIDAQKKSDPNAFVQKERLNPIVLGYKQLDTMGEAYSEIAGLSEKAGKSPVNQYAEQYSAIADKLKTKLRREQPQSNKPQGLLSSELAGGDLLKGEVIQS